MQRIKRRENLIFRWKIITAIFSLLFLVSVVSGYQNVSASGVSALVETKWLADNLNKSDLCIVYVGFMGKDDKANFEKKHIPGSAYLDIGTLMGAVGDGSAAPDKAKFETLMGKLGINNDTHVVLYGMGGGNPFISSAFWLMKYHGHKNVSFLDGGIAKWNTEGRKTTGDPAKVTSTTYKAASADESVRADANYVLNNLNNSNVKIVDVRGDGEYSGKDSVENNKRTGHIPGAVHLNFFPTNLNKDGTFKSVNDLKAVYETNSVTKDKEVITYCQGGVRAGNTYFVLKHLLSYPKVRVYVGSWGEWSKLDPKKYPLEK